MSVFAARWVGSVGVGGDAKVGSSGLTIACIGLVQCDATSPDTLLCDATVVFAGQSRVDNTLSGVYVAMAAHASIVLAEISCYAISSGWVAL